MWSVEIPFAMKLFLSPSPSPLRQSLTRKTTRTPTRSKYLPKSWENISSSAIPPSCQCVVATVTDNTNRSKTCTFVSPPLSPPPQILYEKDESTAVIRRLSVYIIGLRLVSFPASRWMAPRPSVRSETCSRWWWQKSYHSEPPLPPAEQFWRRPSELGAIWRMLYF